MTPILAHDPSESAPDFPMPRDPACPFAPPPETMRLHDPFKNDGIVYGVHELPVSWQGAGDRADRKSVV